MGVARQVLSRIDSTNAHALREAPVAPTWIVALAQESGRGRRGRAWIMPAGNFAGTLALRPKVDAAAFSFVAALALHDALVDVCGPAARLAIKWPNDVLLNGGKVAGILLEGSGGLLAIGIGVNLAAAPDIAQIERRAVTPVSIAGETGHRISPPDFLNVLAPAFAHWQSVLETQGFAPIRQAWLARATKLGEVITARTTQAEITGTFEGIDDTGALLLRTQNGLQAIPAADVFFGD